MKGIGKDDCIILGKCMYGLVKAARQYYKKAEKSDVGFTWGNVDPCLYMKKSMKGIVNVVLYMGHTLMIRSP